MEILGLIESTCWFDACENALAEPILHFLHHFLARVLLRLAQVPKSRPILTGGLSYRIMQTGPLLKQRMVGYNGRIEFNLKCLGVVMHGKVGWVVLLAACISHNTVHDSDNRAKVLFWVPESSASTHQYLVCSRLGWFKTDSRAGHGRASDSLRPQVQLWQTLESRNRVGPPCRELIHSTSVPMTEE
jgi:hypothetical protein